MATVSVTCFAGEWKQLTKTSQTGSVLLRKGNAVVTVSAAEPVTDGNDINTPWAGVFTSVGEDAAYHIAAGEKLWAWSNDKESIFNINPSEGAI